MPRATSKRLPTPRTEVEYLLLADHVEALGGKLYLMGGGWDTLWIGDITRSAPLEIACGIQIPYNETDEEHRLTLAMTTPDGVEIAPPVDIRLRAGRAPTLERGAPTHVPFAVRAEFQFPRHGEYVLSAVVNGREESGRRLPFWVKDARERPR